MLAFSEKKNSCTLQQHVQRCTAVLLSPISRHAAHRSKVTPQDQGRSICTRTHLRPQSSTPRMRASWKTPKLCQEMMPTILSSVPRLTEASPRGETPLLVKTRRAPLAPPLDLQRRVIAVAAASRWTIQLWRFP